VPESFGAGATLQRCHMTPARTDDLYQIVYYPNFKTPSGTYIPRVKIIIIIITNIFVKRHKDVPSEAMAAVGCVC